MSKPLPTVTLTPAMVQALPVMDATRPGFTKGDLAIEVVLAAARAFYYFTEAKGNQNTGQVVEAMLKLCGLGPGYPWCAAFVALAGVRGLMDETNAPKSLWPVPRTAGCYNLGEFGKQRDILRTDFQRGDIFLKYYPSLKRFGHTGFVLAKLPSGQYLTIEGNTNDDGSRDGYKVCLRRQTFGDRDRALRWVALLADKDVVL